MADEPKTVDTPKGGADTGEAKFTQAQLDALISDRLKREREKYADYDSLKSKAETLEADLKKREQAELTELEKIKTEKQKLEESLNEVKPRAEKYDKLVSEWNEQVEAEKDGLTDEQMKIVDALGDPQIKLSLIRQYKAKDTPKGPKLPKGGVPDDYSAEQVSRDMNDPDPEVRKRAKMIHERRKKEMGYTNTINHWGNLKT